MGFELRVVLIAALLALALPAQAQTAADRESARALLDKGDRAMTKKDYAAALDAYAAADELMHVPTTGVSLARAQAASGKLVDARDTALRVTRIPTKKGESDAFREARSEAAELAESIGPRIPSLTVKVTGASDAKVTVDDVAVPSGVPRKLDPGKHTLVATTPDQRSAKQEVNLSEGASAEITLEIGAPAVVPTKTAPANPKRVESDKPAGGRSELVYIGFGVGALGLAVGTVTGLMSLSKTSSVKDRCSGNVCPKSAQDDADSAKTLATISNVGFAVGLLGVGVGVYGLFRSGSPAREAQIGVAGSF